MKTTAIAAFTRTSFFVAIYNIVCYSNRGAVSSTPAGGFPSVFSIGGELLLFTPNLYREGVADMVVTWSDLIQFCILIFAILAYAENEKR